MGAPSDKYAETKAIVDNAANDVLGPEAIEVQRREHLNDALRKIRRLDKRASDPNVKEDKRNKAVADKAALMAENNLTEDDLKAKPKKPKPPRTAKLDDFYAYLPEHDYIFIPTREHWPASTIVAILGPEGMETLDRERAISAKAWVPGLGLVVENKVAVKGGWLDEPGAHTFNTYIPPPPMAQGDATQAGPWIDHVKFVFPEEADHVIKWLAYRVQHLDVKVNHGLVFGSEDQGIGKDTILEPIKRILGQWNVKETTAAQAMDPKFNPHMESLLCCINEATDLGDDDRFAFYNHRKTMMAAPPAIIEVADKHVKLHPVVNVTAIVISTNNKTSGIYLEPSDRRHFVAWSERVKADFNPLELEVNDPELYWNKLYRWFDEGGTEHAAAFLRGLNLSDFNPKAPPPLTEAWHEIVAAGVSTEENELADLIDWVKGPADDERPTVLTLEQLKRAAYSDSDKFGDLADWLSNRRNSKAIPHKLLKAGYTLLRNDGDKLGRWSVGADRMNIYGRKDLSLRVRLDAARELIRAARDKARKDREATKARAAKGTTEEAARVAAR